MTIASSVNMNSDGSSTLFENDGTLVQSNTLSFNEINVPFNEAVPGSTEVDGGTLLLGDGGTISGPMTVAADATLYFGNEPSPQVAFELDAASSISWPGTVQLGGPSVAEDGTYDVSGSTGI